MATRRKLLAAIKETETPLPPNKKFLQDVMKSIEAKSTSDGRKPSKWYKPSGLGCMRAMWFTRLEYPQDSRPPEYNAIGMADTGTRRHTAIQDVLLWMNDNTSDWTYMDVAEYLTYKQRQGKCTNIIVKGKRGAETHLFDTTLQTSFMCDGIIRDNNTGEFYLFEFKNQISFKYNDRTAGTKVAVDKEHHKQVICYCTSLDLEKAFVMYENRDMLALEVPEVFMVTTEMKTDLVGYINECEQYVRNMICPPKPEVVKCNFCAYKAECRRQG